MTQQVTGTKKSLRKSNRTSTETIHLRKVVHWTRVLGSQNDQGPILKIILITADQVIANMLWTTTAITLRTRHPITPTPVCRQKQSRKTRTWKLVSFSLRNVLWWILNSHMKILAAIAASRPDANCTFVEKHCWYYFVEFILLQWFSWKYFLILKYRKHVVDDC